MSSRDTKIKRTLLESGLGLLAKEYEKNPSYGHKSVHDNMVPWALRALGTKMLSQSVEYSMHCINCTKRDELSLSCHKLSVLFGLSTLISIGLITNCVRN